MYDNETDLANYSGSVICISGDYPLGSVQRYLANHVSRWQINSRNDVVMCVIHSKCVRDRIYLVQLHKRKYDLADLSALSA